MTHMVIVSFIKRRMCGKVRLKNSILMIITQFVIPVLSLRNLHKRYVTESIRRIMFLIMWRLRSKIMEFLTERCYTALNADELKPGSKVICANYLESLKTQVEANSYPLYVVE